ncbi:MAG: carboxylesterase family protein [Chloroflexota bacterium]
MIKYLLLGTGTIVFLAYIAQMWYNQNYITPILLNMELHQADDDNLDSILVTQTTQGPVLGGRHPNGVIQFASIPFAQPPLEGLRYASPQPAEPWQGTLDATHVGPRCVQKDEFYMGTWAGGQSEDCLWLSISTPALDEQKRPVLVFIHGGGLHSGGAGEPKYNGAYLAARGDVVAVAIQYRLGVFGRLDVSHLGGEDVQDSAENSTLDQLLALQWIQDNIINFGGDPQNVTIYGESAGSYSVATLLQRAEAEPLFHKSILMSGVYTLGPAAFNRRDVTALYMQLLGVTTLGEMQAKSTSELLSAQEKLIDYATEQGLPDLQALIDLPKPTHDSLRRAGVSGKPLMHGTTKEEYHFFTLLMPDEDDKERKMAVGYLGGIGLNETQVEELVDIIRQQNPNRAEKDVYLDTLTAAFMVYPHHILWREYSSGGAPVYQYLFDWTSPEFPELGAFHALDLAFFFGSLADDVGTVGKNPPQQLSNDMIDALTSFAWTGQPSVPNTDEWRPYTNESRTVMRFGVPSGVIDDAHLWIDEFSETIEAMLNTNQ